MQTISKSAACWLKSSAAKRLPEYESEYNTASSVVSDYWSDQQWPDGVSRMSHFSKRPLSVVMAQKKIDQLHFFVQNLAREFNYELNIVPIDYNTKRKQ